MTRGFIDGATITSALTYLNQGKFAFTPLWHQTSILETTYLLLHEDISIIPRPKGLGGEQGDYAIVAEEMSELIVDSQDRKNVFEATFGYVNNEALDSTNELYRLIKSAWEQVEQNENFLNWADVQRVDRWENQSRTYGALFDKESVSLISKVTGYDIADVKRIYLDSGDAKKVKRWRKRTETWGDAKIANAGWIIGGFIRGFFYDNLAANEGLHLLSHPFRESASVPPSDVEQYDISNSLEAMAKLIIANALNERTKKSRVGTWAQSVKKAREFIQKNAGEYPKLTEPTTHEKALEKAVTLARGIDLEGNAKYLRYGVDAGISLALWGFGIAPWISIPFIFFYKVGVKKSPGDFVGDFVFKSDYYYKWLADSIPGRVERTLPNASRNKSKKTDKAT